MQWDLRLSAEDSSRICCYDYYNKNYYSDLLQWALNKIVHNFKGAKSIIF